MTPKVKGGGAGVSKNMHIMSTNLAKTSVWKHEYDVKL